MSIKYIDYKTADVLVVDDDPIIRKILKHKLSLFMVKSSVGKGGKGKRKLLVDTVSNVEDFLTDITQLKNTYALIIVDENLGSDHLQGSQCISLIRKNGYKNHIISICSDSDSVPKLVKQRVMEAGANSFIHKNSGTMFKIIIKTLSRLVKSDL